MKRFYKKAASSPADAGHAITLDKRPMRTPSGAPLIVPTPALAASIADEWNRVDEDIVPAQMPHTQLANTAIDRTAAQMHEVRSAILGYMETDLLCYRADGPAPLVNLQAKHWDPVLAWLAETHGLALSTTTALVGHSQSAEIHDLAASVLGEADPFALTALYQLTALPGSFALMLALRDGFLSADSVWTASTVDETYQMERWGQDSEATDRLAKKQAEFLAATTFWTSLKTDT